MLIMPRLFVFSFSLFLITTGIIQGQQNASIKGKVIDEQNREAIEYASVAIYSLQDSSLVDGGLTDEAGVFTFQIAKGEYYLKFRFIGYEEIILEKIRVDQVNLDLGDIVLFSGEQTLNEVIVSADKFAIRHKIDRQVFSSAAFEASVGGTASDLLKNLPSVVMNSEGELSVRGSSGFVILIDGKPVQAGASGILNQLPANAVEGIEIITSPSAKFDPEGKAGIINIITKKGATDGVYLLTNLLLGAPSLDDYGNQKTSYRHGGDFTLSIKKKRWDFAVGADYSRNDIAGYRDGNVETYAENTLTAFPSEGERSYRKENYSGRAVVGFEINRNNQINASVYGGTRTEIRTADILYLQTRRIIGEETAFDVFNYFNKNSRERKSSFFIGSLDYTKKFQNKSALTLSTLYERTELTGPTRNLNLNPENHRDTLSFQAMEEYNPLDGIRLNLDYSLPLSEKSVLTAGYQYRWLKHIGEFAFRDKIIGTNQWNLLQDFGSDMDLVRKIHSFYGEYSFKSDKLSYTFGARLEDTDRTLEDYYKNEVYKLKILNFFPSFNVNYVSPKDLVWKANYSRRIERTTTGMMNPFLSRRHSEVLEVGDPELRPELVDAVEAGLVKDFYSNSLFANLYYRRVKDAINRVNTVFNDTILMRVYTNAGISQVYGLEIGADLNPQDWWKIYLGGNLYHFDLQGTAVDRNISRNSWNYSFNLNSSIDLGRNWDWMFNFNYLSRVITVQGVDSRFFSPNTTIKKSLLENRLTLALQWRNMGLGFIPSNRQSISGSGEGFYTHTHYIYERDILLLTASFRINQLTRKPGFSKSEFGEREF